MSPTINTLAADVERHVRAVFDANTVEDAAHITVTAHGDRVILQGTVRSWAEHQDAARAARETPGVAAVDNQLALLVKGTVSS
ncbi:MAG: BON domain-containing protein [Gemmatimonadaceae bacterium]